MSLCCSSQNMLEQKPTCIVRNTLSEKKEPWKENGINFNSTMSWLKRIRWWHILIPVIILVEIGLACLFFSREIENYSIIQDRSVELSFLLWKRLLLWPFSGWTCSRKCFPDKKRFFLFAQISFFIFKSIGNTVFFGEAACALLGF